MKLVYGSSQQSIRMAFPAALAKARRLSRKALRRGVPFFPWRVRPVILMYHAIDDDSFDPWGLSVSPANFQAQMEWLAVGRTVLPLEEFAQRHAKGQLPPDAVAVTFDDGYASVGETAVPLLERMRLPATIFIPADSVERCREFWWDRLARLIIGFQGERLSVLAKMFELGPPLPEDRTWRPHQPPSTPRQRLFKDSWATIRLRSDEGVEAALEEIAAEIGDCAPQEPAKRVMTPQEIRSIHSDVIKIGSHALTHPSLPALSSEDKRREICGSIDRCRELTGEAPRTFAYPFGDFDDESRSLVEQCGFACGCTTEPRPVGPGAPLSRLPRFAAGNWDGELMKQILLEI